MTHTEESLMALADRMYSAPAGTLKNMIEIELRLAIREVLAERDSFYMDYRMKCDEQSKAALVRAEKAEAECERLREDLRGLEEVRREQAAGRDYWSAECERLRKLLVEMRDAEQCLGVNETLIERIDAALKELP